MTDVTLVGEDGVTFTFAEGEVADVASNITSAAEIQSIFGTGPAAAFAYVMDGPKKIITVAGRLFETGTTRTSSGTTTTILQQKQWLEKQINGNQTLQNFTSNYESQSYGATSFVQTQVLRGIMNFREREGFPDELEFSMQFLVGGV